MTIETVRKDKGLLSAFKRYQKRYASVGKKPNIKKFLPEIVYRTMRLEGEKITKRQAQSLFK
ncbi:MAG: hypothetical protein HY376_01780 [Candidatus Blackburnbacteria bacterium]|nr:hypothetical protein [Candidatus Blackburnbacteria bacterium]